MTHSNFHRRPPTPNFNDFDDPVVANEFLTKWMEYIYKKFPRSDWPVFICQREDINQLFNSELYKDYQRLLSKSLVTSKKLEKLDNPKFDT